MTPLHISDPHIAGQLLAAGRLVAIPTETVYGLAAAADDPDAIARVFTVKGRPSTHPLIVHLARVEDVSRWAEDVPDVLVELIQRAWPGPLTIVVPKQAWVPPQITGGQDTVALRVPGLGITREVIEALGSHPGRLAAVVAPSANRFGAVSPTSASHVAASLSPYLGENDAILDAGQCPVGVESTIVTVASRQVTVLRPGGFEVTAADQQVEGVTEQPSGPQSHDVPRVPGSLPSHYAPQATVSVHKALDDNAMAMAVPHRTGLIALRGVSTPADWVRLAAPADDREYAHMLYAALREADQRGLSRVIAVLPTSGGLAPAIADRLHRAAATR
jgi:L-threonylcarbamoyladenylate synthase